MEVIQYLKEKGLENLKNDLHIIVKEYDNLLVLNYDQIRSPKTNPLVIECRGLILDRDFNVVSRSFDRFFNYSENPDSQTHLDFSKAVAYEKVDGSLIKLYHQDGQWSVATRGTAFAESPTAMGPTFRELVLRALGCEDDRDFQQLCSLWLGEEWTYIFEVTSVENRVVKHYTGYTLHYLAARHNRTGEYGDEWEEKQVLSLGARLINSFKFDSAEDCMKTARSLPDLEEGYVIYQDGKPVCKIKSPAYLAVHSLRSSINSKKNVISLVVLGEMDEYLAYYPEEKHLFEPYKKAFDNLLSSLDREWPALHKIVDQKEFALAVKKKTEAGLLFLSRKLDKHPLDAFAEQTINFKVKLLESWMESRG